MLTQEELKNWAVYEPETGLFYSKRTGLIIGKIKITKRKNKIVYNQIRINYKGIRYLAHRLAFLYMVGTIPQFIDHIDCDPLNNKWNNLRSATRQQNSANTRIKKNNTSGFKGVTKRKNSWVARIKINYKYINLGYFKTPIEAANAYNKAAIKYFGEYARLNNV